MFRTALLRTAPALRTVAARPAVSSTRFLSGVARRPVVIAPTRTAAFAVRYYSAGGSLNKEEVEGRIISLLQGFDKVRFRPFSYFFFPGYLLAGTLGEKL